MAMSITEAEIDFKITGGASNSHFEHIRTVEIEIAIGVEFLVFSSISVPIPIWIPIAAIQARP
jgi:hypothetical protein